MMTDVRRGAPCYGEDNHCAYGELLGMSAQEIKALAEEGVIGTTPPPGQRPYDAHALTRPQDGACPSHAMSRATRGPAEIVLW
jgi:hypothetical protein